MGNNNRERCWWCGEDPLYVEYHDKEWGVAVHDDRRWFEMLTLEFFQAGLSWITILRKRENFRAAFADFDVNQVARFSKRDLARLQSDEGIVRHRLKIESAVTNAKCFIAVQEEFGDFDSYVWQFTDGVTLRAKGKLTKEKIPSTSPESIALARDLKQRGFKFMGPTVCYALMQANGMVDDHVATCFKYKGA